MTQQLPVFKADALDVASKAIREIDPTLEQKFAAIVKCMIAFPEQAARPKARVEKDDFGGKEYLVRRALAFAKERKPSTPIIPKTVPDEMVSTILDQYFDVDVAELPAITLTHQWSMAAENFVGELLERYIASVVEESGWVWCAGSVLRAIDFVCPPEGGSDHWNLVQVKNRDNSENSSSSAIRAGTVIRKWFRTYSRSGKTNWENCPFPGELNESGFKTFAVEYFEEFG